MEYIVVSWRVYKVDFVVNVLIFLCGWNFFLCLFIVKDFVFLDKNVIIIWILVLEYVKCVIFVSGFRKNNGEVDLYFGKIYL